MKQRTLSPSHKWSSRGGKAGLACRGLFSASHPCGQRLRNVTRVRLFGSISSLDLLPATSHVGVCAMNPIVFAMRRPVTTFMLVVALSVAASSACTRCGRYLSAAQHA